MKKITLLTLLTFILLASCTANKKTTCIQQSYVPKSFDEAEKWLDAIHNENNVDMSKVLSERISN